MSVNTPGALLHKYAVEQIESAIRALGCPTSKLAAGVHNTRKALRRAAAVLDLGRKRMGPSSTSIRSSLKEACRQLSPLRDADAMIDALDKQIEKQRSNSKIRALGRLRSKLSARRAELLRITLLEDPDLLGLRETLRLLRQELRLLPWKSIAVKDIHHALARSKRRALHAKMRAAHSKSHKARHQWRRLSRCLLHQLDAVEWASRRCAPLGMKAPSRKKLIDRISILGSERDLQMLKRHFANVM